MLRGENDLLKAEMRRRSVIDARMNLPVTADRRVMLRSGYDRGETGVEGAWLRLPLEVREGFEAAAVTAGGGAEATLAESTIRPRAGMIS